MKKLILILFVCISLIFSFISCESNKNIESEMEIKTIDANNSELNYFFNLLQYESENNEKVEFSITHQDQHYQYKTSEEYNGEYWLLPSLSVKISVNYELAQNEEWYKSSVDKEFKTLNTAFFNEYCNWEYEGEITLFGILPLVGFKYEHTEDTISEAIKSFSKDYLSIRKLAELPCVDGIYITYSYGMPGAYFEL